MTQVAAAKVRKGPAPPEDAFWERYSPHHEFPLSSVSSIATHILVFGLMVLVGWAIAKFGLREEQKPVPIDAVAFEPGGGGGHPQGTGVGAGVGDPAANGGTEHAIDEPSGAEDPVADAGPIPREKLQEARKEALKFDEFQDPGTQRLIEDGGRQVDKVLRLSKETREKLRKGLAGIPPGKGQGGEGTGGGKGTGVGTGEGDGFGSGKGTIKRQERVLRWTLIFNTFNGGDYLSQLRGLGAILAIPDSSSEGGYLVIENLNQVPVQPVKKDLSDIKRIYWIDDKPDSVMSLSQALGLNPTPAHVVAFFPAELEKQLLELELKFRGTREEEIRETRFEVRRVGNGRYVPRVISQR